MKGLTFYVLATSIKGYLRANLSIAEEPMKFWCQSMSIKDEQVPCTFSIDKDGTKKPFIIWNTNLQQVKLRQVTVDYSLIIEALLNQNQSLKEGEKLFEMMESNLVQVHLTELGIENIFLVLRQLINDVIADQIITELLEIIQVSPCVLVGDVYISNSSQNCSNNSLLVLSVNDLYQRYLLEQKLL